MVNRRAEPERPADSGNFLSLYRIPNSHGWITNQVQSRYRLIELHPGQSALDSRNGLWCLTNWCLDCNRALLGHVFLDMGDVPYPHTLPRLLQWPD